MLALRIIVSSLLIAALPVQASHCTSYTTSAPEIALLGYYQDTDFCQPDCGPYFWIYEEANGIAGLQRGDEVVDDTCHGMIQADKIIF